MSTVSANASGTQLALSLLSAQAGPSAARAAVLNETVQSDGVYGDKSARTGRYDINSIANAERGLQKARLNDAAQQSRYQDTTSAAERKMEATEREIIRLNKRAKNMSIALQRMGSGPLPEGQRVLSLFSNGPSNAVSVSTTGRVESIYLLGGNQALSIQAKVAQGIYTGGGHDAVAINADWVESVYTDRSAGYEPAVKPDGTPFAQPVAATDSNDAVAIQARWADSIYTGGGNDAIAIQADMIGSVYAGEGADAISIQGGVVSGIHGDAGHDAITVNAAIGMSVMRHFDSSGPRSQGEITYTRPDNVEDRLRMARANYSDVLGGSGNDAISVTVQEIISIDGGEGDDVISVGGGTVGLGVGAGSGNDVVRVSHGAELMIQIDTGTYSVETDGNDLVVRHSGGSVRIEGYESAAAIGIAGFGAALTRTDPIPGSAEAMRVADQENFLSDIKSISKRNEKTNLAVPEVKSNLGFDINTANRDLHMIHIAKPNPLDIRL